MRSARRSLLLLSILLLAALAGSMPAVAEGWLALLSSDSSERVRVEVDEATVHKLSARIELPGLTTGLRSLAEQSFAELSIPEGDLAATVGRPRLPVIRLLVEVPRGAVVTTHLETSPGELFSLEALGLPPRLVPVQPPVPKLPGAADDRLLVIDETWYEQDISWPAQPVAVSGRSVLRGRELVLIEVRPVSYNPAQGTIVVWSVGHLVVESCGGDPCAGKLTDSPWLEQAVLGGVLGSDAFPAPSCQPDGSAGIDSGTGNVGGAEGLIVIVHDDFADAIAPLVEWKTKTGFKVEVEKLSEIGPSPSDADVKNVIQQAYDTWADPTLGFVLIVGDTDFTPIHWGNGGGNSQVTDNWYACLDGTDYLPDVAIARISTRSAAETSDVVDKLLAYERVLFATDDWVKRAGFIGTADAGYWDLIEGTHDWCIDTFYTPNDYDETPWSHGYTSSDRHYRSYDADTSEIAASIDAGRSMVNYSGHGSETSWQGPTSHGSHDQTDVRNNTNDGMYPFVISNACVTGTLNRTECFGETWQKVPQKGAIGFLGASNNSYWNEDDYYQRRLHTHVFPMDDTPPLAIINNRAKIDLYEHYGDTGTVRYYFDMYNLLSEPSLTIWTRRPRVIDVQYDEQVPTGSEQFTVTVNRLGQPVEGELVAVRKQDEGIFSAGYTGSDGSVVLPLEPSPMLPGPMEVTVTGHDDLPHEDQTEVIPVDGPWLRFATHRVEDSGAGCDEDGIGDIGEDARFIVTLENIGSEPATDAWAGLASTADVAVIETPLSLGTIAPGAETEASFLVRIGAGVECQEVAPFEVSFGCSGCESHDDGFSEQLETDQRDEQELESLEHGGLEPEGWSHRALQGQDDWQLVDDANHTPGGLWAYHASDTAMQKEVVLISEEFHPRGIPSLTFWHRYELTPEHSGAAAEISTDDGMTWQDLGPYLVGHRYNSEVGQGESKRDVWSGSSGGWVMTEADLSPFADSTIRLRFHLGTINGTGAGWWIDDVEIRSAFEACDASACGVPNEVELTSVTLDGDDTLLAWWDDPVAVRYRVYRSIDPNGGEDSFDDVTSLDDDDTDASFRDPTDAPFACWIVQGVGPDGDGPWGHFGR
ncbi:MAG: hypothetical protein JSV80_00320 [Acidobacteriota bacterium]|nr:MAG: hypothetical protein JSV80_00320 [Acidobacteriota bacterium]